MSVVCPSRYPPKLVTPVKQQLMNTHQVYSLKPSWNRPTHLWQEFLGNFLLLRTMCRKLAGSPASMPGPWTSMEKAAGLISGARGMDPASLTVQTLCSQQLQSKLVHLGNHMGLGSSVLQPFLTISLSRGGQTPQTSPCTWLLSTAACAGSQAGAPSQCCSYFQTHILI